MTWPATLPGVLVGDPDLLPRIGDFATAQFLGGPDQAMIGDLINQQFTGSGLIPFGAALTMVLLALVLVGVVVGIVLTRDGCGRPHGARGGRRLMARPASSTARASCGSSAPWRWV